MSKKTREREERRDMTRRSLIRWTVAGAAALGLPRWKAFEVLGMAGGKALADSAACSPTNRSVHIIAGNGGFAWFQLLWPHNDIAAANSSTFAFHAPGKQVLATGTDNPLTFAPETPFQKLAGNKQMSAFIGGTNETHTTTPTSSSVIATNTSVFAAAAAIQSVNPTLIPVITVNKMSLGTANGAPRASAVTSSDAIVGLFNSAASRAGGLLAAQPDADFYDAAYKAMLGLQAAAKTPTTNRAYGTAKTASKLLGTNLASQLAVTNTDLMNYGVDATTSTALQEIAKTFIITAKAFELGLTSSVILPAFDDDPHGAFNDMATLESTVTGMGKILDGFYADLMMRDDASCAGKKLGDNFVLSIHGDTPKTPLDRNAWPDNTPGNANWTYVFGNGYLKTGWFGGIDRTGTLTGWDPGTGKASTMTSAQLAAPAAAAIAYAVAKGDMRRVNDFYKGVSINGVVNLNTM